MLVLTGLGLAVVQLESFGALIETGYGIILLVKLTLVVLLLGLAALNRFYLTAMVVADYRNTRPLLRSVVFEGVLVVGILAVVAGWRFTPPPRTLVAEVDAPLAVHIHTDAAMFQVLVSPGKVGSDNFVLQLMNGDAAPLQAKEATLDPQPAGARYRAAGAYRHAGRRWLLARSRRAAALSGPLAHADRGPGDRFREGYTGR